MTITDADVAWAHWKAEKRFREWEKGGFVNPRAGRFGVALEVFSKLLWHVYQD